MWFIWVGIAFDENMQVCGFVHFIFIIFSNLVQVSAQMKNMWYNEFSAGIILSIFNSARPKGDEEISLDQINELIKVCDLSI